MKHLCRLLIQYCIIGLDFIFILTDTNWLICKLFHFKFLFYHQPNLSLYNLIFAKKEMNFKVELHNLIEYCESNVTLFL